jgi:hypothetical protein
LSALADWSSQAAENIFIPNEKTRRLILQSENEGYS